MQRGASQLCVYRGLFERTTRLDTYLTELFGAGAASVGGVSRTSIQRYIETGRIRVNGQVSACSKKLKCCDRIDIDWPEPAKSVCEPVPMALCILYEDDDVLGLSKPAGLLVHPGNSSSEKAAEPTLIHGLLAHSPEAFLGWQGIGDVVRPGIVHRLDRETSGAMIVAKNNASHRCLTQEFAERRVYKEYWGWVWGHPRCRFGQIVTGFERHAVYRQRFTSKTTRGKKAHTEYKVICDAGPVSLVRFILHTGRTHQIRVHCADMGHPIVGDRVYGGCHKLAKAWGMHRHALHSRKLSIACDGSKTKKVCLVAPWPEDFQKIGQALGVSYGEGLEQ